MNAPIAPQRRYTTAICPAAVAEMVEASVVFTAWMMIVAVTASTPATAVPTVARRPHMYPAISNAVIGVRMNGLVNPPVALTAAIVTASSTAVSGHSGSTACACSWK